MNDRQLIWARCQSAQDMRAIAALDAQLREDGDPYTVMPTLQGGPDGVVAPPVGRKQLQSFLELYEPAMLLWVGGAIDIVTLQVCGRASVPSVVVNGSTTMFDNVTRTWLPARRRALIGSIKRILTEDDAALQAALRAGATPDKVLSTGKLAETASILPYDEDDRGDFAEALGTRPVWLAAAVSLDGTPTLIRAHGEASRRAHRLLLVISPYDEGDVGAIFERFTAQGFRTALRSETLNPDQDTQVYIADTPDELGLWHRASPISFIDGSFQDGARADPFAAAALGSVVVHGPKAAEWQEQLTLLDDAGAALCVETPELLGKTIASLLSADRTATLAHAGWDVTTRGAMVLDTLVQTVRQTLEPEVA